VEWEGGGLCFAGFHGAGEEVECEDFHGGRMEVEDGSNCDGRGSEVWFVVVVVVKVSGLRGCGGKVVGMEMRCSSVAGLLEVSLGSCRYCM